MVLELPSKNEFLAMSAKSELVGSRIKFIRIDKHMSQRETAVKVGISQAHMSNIECGRSHCTLENLIKLGEVFEYPLRDFFVDIDKEMDEAKEEKSLFSIVDLANALIQLKK